MHNLPTSLLHFLIFWVAAYIIAWASSISLKTVVAKTPNGRFWMMLPLECILDIVRVLLFSLLIFWLKKYISTSFAFFWIFLIWQVVSDGLKNFEKTLNENVASAHDSTDVDPRILGSRGISILAGVGKKAAKLRVNLHKANLEINFLGYLIAFVTMYGKAF